MSYQFVATPYRLKEDIFHLPKGTIVARDDYGHWYIWDKDTKFFGTSTWKRQTYFRDYWKHLDHEKNQSPMMMGILADTEVKL